MTATTGSSVSLYYRQEGIINNLINFSSDIEDDFFQIIRCCNNQTGVMFRDIMCILYILWFLICLLYLLVADLPLFFTSLKYGSSPENFVEAGR